MNNLNNLINMDDKFIISVSEFSRDPGFRYRDPNDDFSAEEFRDDILLKKWDGKQKIEINLDGTRGISPSFLEELFGGSGSKKNIR